MKQLLCLTVLAVAVLGVTPASQAEMIIYTAFLDGPSEAPPNDSPGIGFAAVGFDSEAHQLAVTALFSGLMGTTTAAHIHGSTAVPGEGTASVVTRVPTFTDFPLGVQSGVYSFTFDTLAEDTYNPAFLTLHGGSTAAAETALGEMLAAGTSYFNIHTNAFPPGEIRGFLNAVPEPSTLIMWGVGGILGLAGYRWRRLKATQA